MGVKTQTPAPLETKPEQEKKMPQLMDNLKETNIFIGIRLREERKKRGLSQNDIGEILRVSHQQIQKYETGDTRLSCASAITLANALGFKVTELFSKPKAPVGFRLHNNMLL